MLAWIFDECREEEIALRKRWGIDFLGQNHYSIKEGKICISVFVLRRRSA